MTNPGTSALVFFAGPTASFNLTEHSYKANPVGTCGGTEGFTITARFFQRIETAYQHGGLYDLLSGAVIDAAPVTLETPVFTMSAQVLSFDGPNAPTRKHNVAFSLELNVLEWM